MGQLNFDGMVNPALVNTAFFLVANVSPVDQGLSQATGTVTFKEGNVTLGSASLVNGTAKLEVSFDTAGSHAITAYYEGSDQYQATSGTVVEWINTPPTASSSSYSATYGQNSIGVSGGDADNDTLSVSTLSAPSFGSASHSGMTIYYTPNSPATSLLETLTFWLSDGRGGSASASVTINLPNDSPSASGSSYTANPGPNTFSVNVSDPNNDPLEITSVSGASFGTVSYSGTSI
jgi:hypothetical protein